MGPIVSAVATALSGVFATLLGLVFNILGIISGAFLWVSVNVFNWVLSPDFISLSYTDPSKNPFLEIGWGLTRDFANIIIVLALVVIGLGTALRLAGYQAQKALPSLILIALLINFTPVICGLIVDASNILMSFFVGEGFAGGNSFVNLALNQWSNISSLAGGLKFWDPVASQEAIAASIGSFVLIMFNFFAALIYLVFALLFALRYVAIWVLVILSPLAFACYILPDTRNVWSQWWKQFIQWSFIGVIAAFFLYLADHFLMATKSTDFLGSAMQEVGNAPGLSSILNSIMPYGIALVFLFIGLMLSLSSSAAGADQILNFTKKGGMKAGKWMGTRGKAFARARVPEAVRRWGERQSTAKRWGEGEKGAKGALKRMVGAPAAGIQRGMGGLITKGMNERLDTEKSHEKAKKQDVASNLRDYRGAGSEAEKAGIMGAMVEKNQLKDALDVDKFGKNALTEGELLKTYEKAVKLGDSDTAEGIERGLVGKPTVNSFAGILNKMDNTKFDAQGLKKEDRNKGYTSYAQKIIGEAKTADAIKQLQKGWEDDDKLMEYAHLSWGGSQISQATTTHGKNFSDKFSKFAQRRGTDWYFEIDPNTNKMRNPDVPRYLSSSGAMSLGIGLAGVNQKEIGKKAFAGRVIEQNPSLSAPYQQYSAIRETRKHIARETKKGADQEAISKAQQKLINAESSLNNNLNILYGTNPNLEKEWDNLMEQLEPKKQGQKRTPYQRRTP